MYIYQMSAVVVVVVWVVHLLTKECQRCIPARSEPALPVGAKYILGGGQEGSRSGKHRICEVCIPFGICGEPSVPSSFFC